MIFDTHAHYDDDAFDGDREELLESLKGAGIGTVVNVGASISSVKTTLALAERYPFIYAAVGVHPSETAELNEKWIGWLRAAAMPKGAEARPEEAAAAPKGADAKPKDAAADANGSDARPEDAAAGPKVVAIGEIGLDYHWDEPEREVQKYWFERQLDLAREASLPIVVHSRDAAKDTLDIIRDKHAGDMGGVIHCFSYGVEIAREYLDMGFYLGVGGVITFKNARKLREVVEYMPMDRILLETDCPYMAPVPFRGKRNSSLYLPYVVGAISEIKGIPAEEVIAVTEANARRMYRIRFECTAYDVPQMMREKGSERLCRLLAIPETR